MRVERDPILRNSFPIGFFDGIFHDNGSSCGAQVFLRLSGAYVFKLKLKSGRGTDIYGELLALWCLSCFYTCRMLEIPT